MVTVKKNSKLVDWFLAKPRTTGLIFLLFLLFVISIISYQRYQIVREGKEKDISHVLDAVEQNLEQSLKNYSTIALTLALTVDNNGTPQNFDAVASKLIASNPDIQAIQLVPGGVIKYIYPLKGNEEALNLNLFKSNRGTVLELQKVIQGRKMYFQGPVKLNQGGIGIVGRLPLFINNKFWGFSAVVIKFDTLLKLAGVNNDKYKDYRFQFSKVSLLTQKEEFFLPGKFDLSERQFKTIVFPDGDWKLYVINLSRYDNVLQVTYAVLFGLVLAGLSSYLLMRLLKNQGQLQGLVNFQATQLLSTENKFKTIFDHAAVGIGRVNSVTGEFLEVNQYLCDFLGYTEKELIGKKIKSVIYIEDLQEEARLFKQLLAGQIREFSIEKRYINKEGKVVWGSVIITALWEEGEKPSNHIIIVEDITQRKKDEQVLIESQQRIEELINTIDGIVWEGNPDDETCTFISKKVEDILGYPAKQWMSKPQFWLQNLHPDDREWAQAYSSTAIAEKRQHDFEYRMLAKDGSVVWFRDIVNIVLDQGKTLKLRGIMIDITQTKEAEAALNKSFHLVNEQNKRLLNFSHIVSHNLRSHASNIEGISTLIESAKSEEDRNEMIQLLKKVVFNLNETLFNLNNVVNIQTSIDVITEPLNLSEYIVKTLATQNAQILIKNAVILDKVSDEIYITYNRAYLESILLNLVSNALRYSHKERSPVITLTCFEENGQLVLRVSDNGIGIDLKKYGDKMFGLYQTFNGNDDARGFGLFITKNQVEAMGGKIEVESAMNQGSTFKIYFKPMQNAS